MNVDFAHHARFLGLRVKDRITGFEGVAASVCFDVYGCVMTCITPPINKEGKLEDGRWFDNARIEVLSIEVVQPVAGYPVSRDAGGGFSKPGR